MAFAIMFRLDETSISKHLGERTKSQEKEDGSVATETDASSGSVSLTSSLADVESFENDANTTNTVTEITPSGEEKSVAATESQPSIKEEETLSAEKEVASNEAGSNPLAETASVSIADDGSDSDDNGIDDAPTPTPTPRAEEPVNKYKLNYTMEEREQEEFGEEEDEKEDTKEKPGIILFK